MTRRSTMPASPGREVSAVTTAASSSAVAAASCGTTGRRGSNRGAWAATTACGEPSVEATSRPDRSRTGRPMVAAYAVTPRRGDHDQGSLVVHSQRPPVRQADQQAVVAGISGDDRHCLRLRTLPAQDVPLALAGQHHGGRDDPAVVGQPLGVQPVHGLLCQQRPTPLRRTHRLAVPGAVREHHQRGVHLVQRGVAGGEGEVEPFPGRLLPGEHESAELFQVPRHTTRPVSSPRPVRRPARQPVRRPARPRTGGGTGRSGRYGRSHLPPVPRYLCVG